jgi:hypothetical protein
MIASGEEDFHYDYKKPCVADGSVVYSGPVEHYGGNNAESTDWILI